MLGSTRPTVNIVAGTLQKAGLITYTHGHMTVFDRQGLEAGACECYRAVKSHFDRLGIAIARPAHVTPPPARRCSGPPCRSGRAAHC
jgi:Crp-like helix-turn-helix protein